MTEEAKKIVEALRMCHDPKYGCYDCPVDVPGEPCQNELKAADLIESLSAENEILNAAIGQLGTIECHRDMLEHELEQVTSERDGLNIMLSQAMAMLEARTRERDAAFRYIKRGCRACSACRYGDDTPENNEVCDKCIPNPEGYSEWQWEGVEVTDNAQKGSDAKS